MKKIINSDNEEFKDRCSFIDKDIKRIRKFEYDWY